MQPAILGNLPIRLISEQEISLGDAHIATKDGEAMFFHDSIDFSGYEGTDAGSTPYYLEFIDDSGLIATAYAGAAGGGETLGAELITGWTNYPSHPYETFTTAGTDITSAINTADTGVAYDDIESDGGVLYKYCGDLTINDGVLNYLLWRENITSGESVAILKSPESGSKIIYRTGNSAVRYFEFLRISGSLNFSVINNSLKALTDIPATGLHLLSTKNGTTRNMASIEDGFDPNRITEIRVWRV